ncbi:MAG: thiamine diphosphokinase [Clostridia bacterium]|nr:thiamine diphosphokinase [Clostridia bacterium]
MKAFIYTGGTIYPENITEHPKSDDIRIAADGGYNNATLLGEKVDIALGDFDSLGKAADEIPENVEKIKVPAEKDETDTQLAVNLALSRGADDLVIIGGLDGRLDHTLSNLAILEAMSEMGVHCVMTNGQNRARYIRSTSTLIARSGFKYLSIIAADESVKGVSAEGCKYPLKNARLSRKFQYAVSNEIVGNCALISVKKGGVFIVESRDI